MGTQSYTDEGVSEHYTAIVEIKHVRPVQVKVDPPMRSSTSVTKKQTDDVGRIVVRSNSLTSLLRQVKAHLDIVAVESGEDVVEGPETSDRRRASEMASDRGLL